MPAVNHCGWSGGALRALPKMFFQAFWGSETIVIQKINRSASSALCAELQVWEKKSLECMRNLLCSSECLWSTLLKYMGEETWAQLTGYWSHLVATFYLVV